MATFVWREGAIAFLDALGFKGIWGRCDPGAVVRSMQESEQRIRQQVANQSQTTCRVLASGSLRAEVDVRFFSDSIILAYSTDLLGPNLAQEQSELIRAYLTFTGALSSAFALFAGTVRDEGLVPLNYRGAISYGRFILDGNFLLGPAVDEAAEAERRADAAVVYLTETARDAYPAILNLPARGIIDPRGAVFSYDVPMKAGPSAFSTLVVNPFAVCSNPEEVILTARGMRKAFGSPTDPRAMTKVENTWKMMRAAEAAWYAAVEGRKRAGDE